MGSKNEVNLVGNLGVDPTLRHTQSGKKVASARLATTTGKEGKEKTQWHNIVCWETQAERLMRMKKGSTVNCQGRIEYRSYKNRQDVEVWITEVVVSWLFMDIPKGCQDDRAPAPDQGDGFGGPGVDDIPF